MPMLVSRAPNSMWAIMSSVSAVPSVDARVKLADEMSSLPIPWVPNSTPTS